MDTHEETRRRHSERSNAHHLDHVLDVVTCAFLGASKTTAEYPGFQVRCLRQRVEAQNLATRCNLRVANGKTVRASEVEFR